MVVQIENINAEFFYLQEELLMLDTNQWALKSCKLRHVKSVLEDEVPSCSKTLLSALLC